jgi:hypothetical protein
MEGYGLEDWGSISGRCKNRLRGHPAAYPVGSGGSFLGGKVAGA